MPKIGMGPIRRQQLMDATLNSVCEVGLADTTIARISKQAGVSSGIIAHYFGGKNELLEATMRNLLRELGEGIQKRVKKASTPLECLYAIIDGNFSEHQINSRATRAWLAFWAQALHTPALSRLQRVNQFRLQSNLAYWLKKLVPNDQALETAEGLAAIIDGLWLRGAFLENGVDAGRCRQIARNFLDQQISESKPGLTKL